MDNTLKPQSTIIKGGQMNTQMVGYEAKEFQPRNLAIYILIASVLPIMFFTPFIFGILKWPARVSLGLGLFMILLNSVPLIVAFVMTAITEGKTGVKALLGRLWNGNLSIKWLLIALLIWPTVFLVINLLARSLEGYASYPVFSFLGQPWTYFPSAYLNGLLIVIIEEFGWRGYVLPRLQARWNALTSSIIVGAFWALMHLPNWFIPPGNPNRNDSFWNFAVQIILASILYTWIFNNTRGNILGVILAHTMSNTVGALIGVPDSYLTYINWVLLLAVISVVIIFGPKNLVKQKREKATEQDIVHAISD
jgi:membrane protease YdiL (CAAX protease family)